jgi:2-amino-1-hydroxyethylphosphonate dioxygenase (glycine-forming)
MMTSTQTIEEIADEIIGMYENHGNQDYIGEPVSQIEHMCQCAELAEAQGAKDDEILAALFHDIGHLYEFAFPEAGVKHMDDLGMVDHERLGAAYLQEKGFSKKIVLMVQHHVEAKRYLTYHFPDYYQQLSDASKKTLELQGGRMTLTEAMVFEASIYFNECVALRKWDDSAKQINKPLPNLSNYKDMIIEHLAIQNS